MSFIAPVEQEMQRKLEPHILHSAWSFFYILFLFLFFNNISIIRVNLRKY